MEPVENTLFGDEVLLVDGKAFKGCQFNGTALLFKGGDVPSFENCRFDAVTLQFGGGAMNTLRFLSGIRTGGFTTAVNRILDSIRPQR